MQLNIIGSIVDTLRRSSNSRNLLKIYRCSIMSLISDMSANNDSRLLNDDINSRKVYVQRNSADNMMTISFDYIKPDFTKQFNLYRRTDEPLKASLERIKLNLVKLNKKASKKPKLEEQKSDEVNIKLLIGDKTLDPEVSTNIDAWVEGAIFKLGDVPYYVTTDSPQVEKIRLPNSIMQGFTTVPMVSLVNCTLNDCKFTWFRRISRKEKDQFAANPDFTEDMVELDQSYWYRLCDNMFYCPTEDDIAHELRVVCWPSDGVKRGPKTDAVSTSPVELGPTEFPFEKRFVETSTRLVEVNQFRVVSYNILADLYADQDYSRDHLFAHCPPHALNYDYRRQLLLKELEGYNADIICLQEVDQKEFKRSLAPFLDNVTKHDGLFCRKGGQVAEGVATFYARDKFELVDSHKTLLAELIENRPNIQKLMNEWRKDESGDVNKSQSSEEEDSHFILKDRESSESKKCLTGFENIRSAIISNDKLKKRFLSRHTVMQTTLLKLKGDQESYVIVANTHLYFAPDADHVRLLQGSCCVKYLEYIKDFYSRKFKEDNPHAETAIGIVFCGDMNSTPECGLYKLATSGAVSDNVPDWSSNKEEKVVGLNLETSLRFVSSYTDLKYTNFTPLFNGCLDYIYLATDNLECDSTVPLPDHEDVIKTGGIPSDVFPSDHLALISNVRFKTQR